MKTRFIIAAIMFICLSCSSNKPLSDTARENAIHGVKNVMSSLVKGMEQVNPDAIIGASLNSPEFTFQVNGMIGNYDQFIKAVKDYLGPLTSQKIELFNEKYAVLDKSTVLYSSDCKCKVNFKDGRVTFQDPWALQFLFTKKGGQWKLASWTEYGSEKELKSANTVNQQEEMKKFLGTWKAEVGKDTFYLLDIKSFHNSYYSSMKTRNKGKILYERKSQMGYDKTNNKIIVSVLNNDTPENTILCGWFNSPGVFEEVPYESLENPSTSQYRWKFEFKGNQMTWNDIVDNKTVKSYTYIKQ